METLFVVIEGIDGSGKTTLVHGITDLLVRKGVSVVSFKEPGDDNPLGRTFREMSRRGAKVPPLTTVCLLAAERFWRTEQVRRWLAEGKIVLADRYYLSGMVYCGAEGVPFDRFSAIHDGVLKPHLYIYLDVPLTTALSRKGEARDRWEETDLAVRVVCLYPRALRYVRSWGSSEVCTIDGTKPESEVLSKAFACIWQRVRL